MMVMENGNKKKVFFFSRTVTDIGLSTSPIVNISKRTRRKIDNLNSAYLCSPLSLFVPNEFFL